MGLCGTGKRKAIAAGCTGFCLLALGIGLIPIINIVVNRKVKDSVVLKEGGLLYDIWKNTTLPVFMQFFMFDITNPDEVKDGKKAFLVQKGPYTYKETRYKVNITHHSNGTISYRQIRKFTFVPDMSHGNESDMVTTINPPLLTLLNALRHESDAVKKLIGLVLTLETADIFIHRPVKEVLWGYTDPLLKVAKTFDKSWFYTDWVGYFINKNDTDDGVYNVFTGEDDIHKLGVIDKYNGSSSLGFWTTPWANLVNGTDGTVAPPFIQDVQQLPTFSSDICRSVFGVYTADVKSPQGIPLHRFTGTSEQLASPSVDPDNIGFCTPQSSCFDTGVLNVSACETLDYFHIPGAVSFPHFLMGADKYIHGVIGLSPNQQEHETTVDIEPLTGLVLQAAKKLQVNMHINPVPGIKQFYNITEVVMPILWVNESVKVDESHAEQLQNLLFTPLLLTDILKYGLIGLGALILMCALLAGIYLTKTGPVSTELQEPCDRRPLITDGGETTDIHNGNARRHSYGSTHSSND